MFSNIRSLLEENKVRLKLGLTAFRFLFNDSFTVQEEPGGQRALIFDQGDRITQVDFGYFICVFVSIERWIMTAPFQWLRLQLLNLIANILNKYQESSPKTQVTFMCPHMMLQLFTMT